MLQDQEQKMNRIAIIGSGITGISVGFQHPAKTQITMFDKSRRPGGRVCTRTSRQHPGYSFDHGTSFLYHKNQFFNLLQKLDAVKQHNLKCADYVNKQQLKTFEKTYIGGNPQIQTIPLKLIEQLKQRTKLNLEFDTRITSISQSKHNQKNRFVLQSQQNKQFGPFDQVYVCIPYPQCKTLKQSIVQFPKQEPTSSNYLCTWVLMVAAQKQSILSELFGNYDIVKNVDENIQSMVNQRTKGNKSDDNLWVFTMNQNWSQKNINLKPQNVEQQFRLIIKKLVNKQVQLKFLKAHRWLYSKPKQTPQKPLKGRNIVFGADWVGKRSYVQQCWDLGPILYKIMNEKSSNL